MEQRWRADRGGGRPRRNGPEREERDMTSTTGTTTTSRTRMNKRSTSRITGLKACRNKQVNEAYCNSGVRAQLDDTAQESATSPRSTMSDVRMPQQRGACASGRGGSVTAARPPDLVTSKPASTAIAAIDSSCRRIAYAIDRSSCSTCLRTSGLSLRYAMNCAIAELLIRLTSLICRLT